VKMEEIKTEMANLIREAEKIGWFIESIDFSTGVNRHSPERDVFMAIKSHFKDQKNK